jgi:pimeloyl-ACP methyl ester carboxylesterase
MSEPQQGERTIEAEGGHLFLEVGGAGPGVVLIHPGLWDSRTWDDQWESFAARHRVARYDVRGYGRSSRPTGKPYSHVRDLAAVMDAAGLERGALVGCSMGGAIALNAALAMPDRVTALVLAASGLDGFEGSDEEEREWEERFGPIEALVEAGELEQAQDIRLRTWAPLGTDDGAGRRIRAIAMDNLHELTMDESAAEDLHPTAIDRLHEIACPTLVLPADHDPPHMRRVAGILGDRIPQARIEHIPNVDHVLNMRAPEAFNHIVLGFLDEV